MVSHTVHVTERFLLTRKNIESIFMISGRWLPGHI